MSKPGEADEQFKELIRRNLSVIAEARLSIMVIELEAKRQIEIYNRVIDAANSTLNHLVQSEEEEE